MVSDGPGGYVTRIETSIHSVPRSEWNAITGRNRVWTHHEFLSAVEDAGVNDCRFCYATTSDNSGLAACACAYTITTDLDTFAPVALKDVSGRIRRWWPGFFRMRTLECGTPVCLGDTISVRDDVDAGMATVELARALEEYARQHGVSTTLFRDFDDVGSGKVNALRGMRYTTVRNLPNARLRVDWKSFDAYLEAMRMRYRRKVRSRRDRFTENGFRMHRIDDFRDISADLARLWRNTYDRAMEYRREVLTEGFFRSVAGSMGRRATVLLATRDGRPVGFMLVLLDDDSLIALFCGLDYGCNIQGEVYFNLLYETIRTAVESGLREIDLGITTLAAKTELGAHVVPLWVLMKDRRFSCLPRIFDWMMPRQTVPTFRVFK